MTWFPGLGARPFASHRAFCFPFAGGTPNAYRTLQERAPDWIEVVPVLLPGRDMRIMDAPVATIDAFLDAVLPVITPHLAGSFGFIGYSMGSRLAYRLTHRLRDMGFAQPRYLMICAHDWPFSGVERDHLYTLPSPQFWKKIAAYGGTPGEIMQHPDLMDLLEPMLRADFAMAFEEFPRPDTPLDLPLVALSAMDDPYANPAAMSAWAQETTGEFTQIPLPGEHFVIQSAPELFARTVLEQVKKYGVR